jgi:hypothetical protein
MRKLLLIATLAPLVLIAGVAAQAPPRVAVIGGAIPIIGSNDEPIPGKVVQLAAPDEEGNPGQPGAAVAKAPKESARYTSLKTLQFDRRPSAILKAWAPEKKDTKTPEAKKTPEQLKTEAITQELNVYKLAVILGDWAKVKSLLANWPDEEATLAYKMTVQGILRSQGPNMGGAPDPDQLQNVDEQIQQMIMRNVPGAMQYSERNTYTVEDVLGLASIAPNGLNPKFVDGRSAVAGYAAVASQAPKGLVDKEHLPSFGNMLRQTISGGTLPEVVVAKLKAEAAKPVEQRVLSPRQIAKILTFAGQQAYAGSFLPTPEECIKAKDVEGLNLLSQHYLALHAKEQKSGNLEKAWNAVQMALTFPDGTREQLEESLLRAVDLAPKVTDKLGEEWLQESFTKKLDRGMDIIATVGTLVSQGLSSKPFATEERLNAIKLMKTAVEALLKASPAKATEWKRTLTILASAWLKEAEFSQQYDRSTNPRMQSDRFGNIFFSMMDDDDDNRFRFNQRPDMPRPIPVSDIVLNRPSVDWIKSIDEGLRPKLAGVLAQLHLKLSEEDKAFPLIEQLATAQPNEAKNLTKEFLRVWTRNHNPNEQRNRYRYSWFFYGMENRADTIPLTRSKQERNLQELSGWVKRIRAVPALADLDDDLFVKAFTACHSSSEVYKTEAIESVFGPLGGLKPRVLAGLAQQMRMNLAQLWREPSEQERNKTKRKKKDIEQEVLRGYEVANKTVADGLKKFPDHWALLAAQACLMHDEINYRQELAKASDFSLKRSAAFAVFKKAADQYNKEALKLPQDERTEQVYEYWFSSALGAVDLGMITEEKFPDWKQPALIKATLESIPGEVGKKHVDRFANSLFTRLSGAKPHVKFNYLKAGFEVVGDHKQAAEARKVFDYYKDLVREIKLQTIVDGSSNVGNGRPFGIFVNFLHTRDIERESGGFSRYLQNQNSNNFFSYNYGRPTADYRDRFEQAAKEALKEHFEVVSVTFQDEKVTSRAAAEYGWRYTPYAYILLKPRGPHVDKVPSLRIDLDFLDTSGYAVLPVESAIVPIDCKSSDPRPVTNLNVTMTLDERQANKGTLILEVKAAANGLIPEIEKLCGPLAPEGFLVEKVEDQGLAVKKFDEDALKNLVVSERVWMVTMRGRETMKGIPKVYSFPDVLLPTKVPDGLLYQRYADADLNAVQQTVTLEMSYGKKSPWAAIITGVVVLIVFGLFIVGVILFIMSSQTKTTQTTSNLPENLTPFMVLEILDNVRNRAGSLAPGEQEELKRDIRIVEEHYFGDQTGNNSPDLKAIARRWISRA